MSCGTARMIVERLVAKYAGQHEITVATSDLMEQQTVTSFGALVVSAEGLRDYLDEARRDLSRQLKALKKENAELKRANEILKAAASFFAAELDRPHTRS